MSIINFVPLHKSRHDESEERIEFRPNDKSTRILSSDSISNKDALLVKYDPDYTDFVKQHFFHFSVRASSSTKPVRMHWWHSLLLSTLKQPRNNIDHLLGFICSLWLYIYSPLIISFLTRTYEYYAFIKVEVYVRWLMGWPAGLKLNSNLDHFLGEMFLWLLHSFHSYLHPQQFIPSLTYLAVTLSFFIGLSPLLALAVDSLKVLNLHFFLFYRIALRLYQWQVRALLSLFHLFRGKKWNVLRTRMDSNDYDLDQLLLGTVLFTLLFFGFPTIIVYYFLFGLVRILLDSTLLGLNVGLAMLAALREYSASEADSFHFEQKENYIELVVEERSAFSHYLRNVKGRIHLPRINLKKILLGMNAK